MTLRRGNMFTDSQPDVLLATSNAYVNSSGALVMGKGAALEMVERYPGVQYELGAGVRQMIKGLPMAFYGMVILPTRQPMLGIFQVKYGYSEKANLMLIDRSCFLLRSYCRTDLRGKKVVMNFPGIGCGGLGRAEVLPLIESLPHNVEVWEHD